MKEKRNWKFSRDPEMRLKIAKYAEMHGLMKRPKNIIWEG